MAASSHTALLLLALYLAATCGATVTRTTPQVTARLSETAMAPPAGLQAGAASGGAGEGQGPARLSGFFKLDRTADAHMFYFLFESRSMKADDPVVLWMTGESPLPPTAAAIRSSRLSNFTSSPCYASKSTTRASKRSL